MENPLVLLDSQNSCTTEEFSLSEPRGVVEPVCCGIGLITNSLINLCVCVRERVIFITRSNSITLNKLSD